MPALHFGVVDWGIEHLLVSPGGVLVDSCVWVLVVYQKLLTHLVPVDAFDFVDQCGGLIDPF